jgi:hypothetical protein
MKLSIGKDSYIMSVAVAGQFTCTKVKVKVKVKEDRNRPERAQRGSRGIALILSRPRN